MIVRHLLSAAVIASSLLQVAAAQDSGMREKLAREALDKARVTSVLEQMGAQMLIAIEPMMRQGLVQDGVKPADLDKALSIFRENMRRELTGTAFRGQMIDAAVKEYAAEFDESQLRALIAFYDSPVGMKLIERQPVLMQKLMTAGQRLGEEGGRRAGQATVRALREQGLVPAGK